MRVKHEMAMRCDAKILAMRVLAAEISSAMRSHDAKTLAMRCRDAGHSECHFPLRVAGRVAPNRVGPLNSYKL